ncbi:MAG: hypothetical protein H0U63_03240 [Burkholderiales bacterium]|nr:hypothetical protein [Burkholderiales bacterium]
MFLAFGQFSPDVADVGTDTLDVARNVYPASNSWKPFNQPTARSTSLPSACKGLASEPLTSGVFATYAGTTTKLYKFNASTQLWTDVSRVAGGNYATPADGFWSFAHFGNLLIATNGFDVVQFIDVTVGTNFAALAGSPPTAKHVTIVEDRVMLAGLTAAPSSIAWSDINNATVWTPGVGLADQQAFSSGGNAQAVCSAARLVLQERGMRAIIPTGDVTSFQFEEVASAKGALSARSVIAVGPLAFWLSEDGFYMGNSSEQRAISANRVTDYFFDKLLRERSYQVTGAADPLATRVYWSYPTQSTDYNDYIIGYDWSLDKWFEIKFTTYAMAITATAGLTLEELDAFGTLETLAFSMDSTTWSGGATYMSLIDQDNKLAYFSGQPMEVTLETGNVQFAPGRRVKATWARPLIEGTGGSSAMLEVGRRQRLTDEPAWTVPASMAASGRIPIYASGAYHRFRLVVPAGTIWEHAQGMDVEFAQEGVR